MDRFALLALALAKRGGSSGAVSSVNGQTGTVVLDAEDVGAQTPFLTATVTIATTDWQAATSGYACTKTVTGMTDDAAVFLQYSDSETDYTATQDDDAMTFACDAVPSEAVTVSVLWFKAVSV